jgi:hypothetical protein
VALNFAWSQSLEKRRFPLYCRDRPWARILSSIAASSDTIRMRFREVVLFPEIRLQVIKLCPWIIARFGLRRRDPRSYSSYGLSLRTQMLRNRGLTRGS